MCIAFTRKHVLQGSWVDSACERIGSYHGADDGTHNAGLKLLRNAILSLSAAFFGIQKQQRAMMHRGYRQYSDVLRQLKNHVADRQLQGTNETLWTVATCMLLEIFLPSEPATFLMHIRGIEAILESRGPPSVATGDAAFIASNFRAMMIIGALADGRASLWAKTGWRFLPPASTDHETLIKHQCWNLLADCTQAAGERNRVSDGGSILQYEQLKATMRTLLQRSETTFLEWSIYNNNLQGAGTSLTDSHARTPTRDAALSYLLCNGAHICILQLAHSIDPGLSFGRSYHEAATNILNCLDLHYFDKQEANVEDNAIGFFVTKVAWEALGKHSSVKGTRLARIVRASTNGTFYTGTFWDYGGSVHEKVVPEDTDRVKPEHTQKTIRDRWDLPLWTQIRPLAQRDTVTDGSGSTSGRSDYLLKEAIATCGAALLTANQHHNLTVRPPPSVANASTSPQLVEETLNGNPFSGSSASSYASPLVGTTDSTLSNERSICGSPQDAPDTFVPGPLDFSDPLLGDIF
jgi:hypothetical protein